MSIASTVSIFQSTLPRRERRGRSAHCGTSSTFQSTLPRRERRSAGLAPAFSSMHFNPRSREGSDVAGRPIAASEPFQSTLPRRERRASSAVMGKAAAFQSTLPRRERRRLSRIRTGGGTISIHAPAKGATIQPFWTAERSPVFQSTLPRRERRDIPTPKVTPRHEISIHAPAKGATPLASEVKQQLSISIHAPAKGATDNNRPRNACGFISIHAPAKGATVDGQLELRDLDEFQSTLPRRERPWHTVEIDPATLFQSTLPRRERLARRPDAAALSDFNPRSREGSDFICLFVMMILVDFNPRSREGSDMG